MKFNFLKKENERAKQYLNSAIDYAEQTEKLVILK